MNFDSLVAPTAVLTNALLTHGQSQQHPRHFGYAHPTINPYLTHHLNLPTLYGDYGSKVCKGMLKFTGNIMPLIRAF